MVKHDPPKRSRPSLHESAVKAGVEVVYPLTDEPWGARRFFVNDPNGRVVNLMEHLTKRLHDLERRLPERSKGRSPELSIFR